MRLVDGLNNRLFLDPVLRGGYPADMLELFGRFGAADVIRPGDERVIAAPIDLLGVNYYQPGVVRAKVGAPAMPTHPGTEGVEPVHWQGPTTDMDWPVDPGALADTLVRLSTDYPGTPLMVTENGAAYVDVVEGERVADPQRIAFLDGHLRACHDALRRGADLRGYLAWSLMDNFEWGYGYGKRFGLVHVDYDTQRRVPKDSALWFQGVIARNGLA